MTAQQTINELHRRSILIRPDGIGLKLVGQTSAITPSLTEAVKAHRKSLIFFASQTTPNPKMTDLQFQLLVAHQEGFDYVFIDGEKIKVYDHVVKEKPAHKPPSSLKRSQIKMDL